VTDFLGVPVTGEPSRFTSARVKQDDPAKLLEAINRVLDHPLVLSLKWTQYTPYFNDGDACEFGLHREPAVSIEGGDEDEGDYEDGFYSAWDLDGHYYEGLKKLELGDLYDRLRAATDELYSGRHYDILAEKFGDPAEVVATKEGFHIEFYDHE
jgi:hypothetical protein